MRKRYINIDTLRRLAFCNSRKLPQVIADGGERFQWVGIGWVHEGKARGNEVIVRRPKKVDKLAGDV